MKSSLEKLKTKRLKDLLKLNELRIKSAYHRNALYTEYRLRKRTGGALLCNQANYPGTSRGRNPPL